MAIGFVRWYDPTRARPLRRDFHRRAEAEAFRASLPYLSEPFKSYPANKSRAKRDGPLKPIERRPR